MLPNVEGIATHQCASRAIATMRSGLIQKPTLFQIAGIAFLFLIALDRAKTRYDIENDKTMLLLITVS